jgi:hypothetical protein
MLFSFGRDVNISWKHGVNALHPEEQDGKGRISIILWGLCKNVIEEEGSPPMVDNQRHGGYFGPPRECKMQHCKDYERGHCSYGDRCKFSHSSSK